MISLRPVTDGDAQFLYELLRERDPSINVFHRAMPTFAQHCEFMASKPYDFWYIIQDNGAAAGSIYLTNHDEVGIFLTKDAQDKGIGTIALHLLAEKTQRKRLIANIAPTNPKSIGFFEKHGFRLIQHTYEISL